MSKLGLSPVRNGRSDADISGDINALGYIYLSTSHHIYTPGRTQSYMSVDAFMEGAVKLQDGRLEAFVEQVVREDSFKENANT